MVTIPAPTPRDLGPTAMKPEVSLKTTATAEASFSGAMAAAGEVAVAAVDMVAVEGAVEDEADGKGFGFLHLSLLPRIRVLASYQ